MNKSLKLFVLPLLILFVYGCDSTADKSLSLSIVYFAIAVISLLLLLSCVFVFKVKEPWLLLLFVSVFVVNTGYFFLSVTQSVGMALHANRVAYFGSVFLPFSMHMIIKNITGIEYKKWITCTLVAISIAVFLLAASPGILDWYYKEVHLETVNGITVLKKEYGPLHGVYLFYLLGYFCAMVSTIIYAYAKHKIENVAHAAIMAIAVFANIGVWLIEQLVDIEFEFLSVSYIISELFLFGIYAMIWESERAKAAAVNAAIAEVSVPKQASQIVFPNVRISEEKRAEYIRGVADLTNTERIIFNMYLERKGTKEVMAALGITENTLKFHNKNIYGKLGGSSRKQLLELALAIENK